MAYTYLIGWSSLNKWYYGVRYAKKASPSDLFTTYFTSSKYVKSFIKDHGLPDVVEVRKVFEDKKHAMLWEHKVLRRLDVVSDDKWINKTDNFAIDFKTSKRNTLPGMIAAQVVNKGKSLVEKVGAEKAELLKEAGRKRTTAMWASGKGNPNKSTTDGYREAAHRTWADPEIRQRRSESVKLWWAKKRSMGG